MPPRTTRVLALDIPLGILLGSLVLFATRAQLGMGEGGPQPGAAGPPWAGDRLPPLPVTVYAAVAVATAGVMAQRVWPRTAFALTAAAVTGFLATGRPFGPILLLFAVGLFSLAVTLPPRVWAPWSALILPVIAAGWSGPLSPWRADPATLRSAVGFLALTVLAMALGSLVRIRRENTRRDREEELRRSLYEERLRIAREVHDVVGHSLSVISMQAGVALHVLDRRPEQAAPSLEAIRRTSNEALAELRGTLAVFRDPDNGREPRATGPAASPAPLPGLERVGDLVATVTAAGRRARLQIHGDPSHPPAAVGHAAYRIVQEALTNAVRHADGADILVTLSHLPTHLVVEVADDGPARSAPVEGTGITGMRERARAVGGALRAGPRPGGGFEVRAELPLRGAGEGG